MKKKGFTLIELLAVIVILAVIALIATPLIMNTINDAKDSAMQRSVQNIQHAVEQHVMSKKVLDENYTFTMSDFNYKGEKYDKMNIGFNDKDEAGVSVYKDNKCFYVLAGTSNVVIDKDLDEEGCLAKAGEIVKIPDTPEIPGENETCKTIDIIDGFERTECNTISWDGNVSGKTTADGLTNDFAWAHISEKTFDDSNDILVEITSVTTGEKAYSLVKPYKPEDGGYCSINTTMVISVYDGSLITSTWKPKETGTWFSYSDSTIGLNATYAFESGDSSFYISAISVPGINWNE